MTVCKESKQLKIDTSEENQIIVVPPMPSNVFRAISTATIDKMLTVTLFLTLCSVVTITPPGHESVSQQSQIIV